MADNNNIYSFALRPEDHQPSGNIYSFALRPEDHQPTGVCDFRKIYTPNDMIVSSGDGKWYPVERRVKIDKNGNEIVTYIMDIKKLDEIKKNETQA
jgi:hypothetical protein